MSESFMSEQSDDSKQNSNARTKEETGLNLFFTQEFLESLIKPMNDLKWDRNPSAHQECQCGKPLVESGNSNSKS